MALSKVPAPVLDLRNGDQVVASAIGSLPAELSDRSDSNPAVVILEANGSVFDAYIYQLNQWPSAVITKCLALVGVNVNSAQVATVTEQFTLSAPQARDTTIPKGTTVTSTDGTVSFSTLSDLTIRAYSAPAGTITLTAGSTTVTGSGTSFLSSAPAGYQISTDHNTWYTVASVGGDTSLTLTSSAASTVSGSVYYSGAVTGTVNAQSSTAGLAQNVAAASLTTLQSSVSGVGTVTNPAVASGGADAETTTQAIARAPVAFSSRDTAVGVSDFSTFAAKILGTGGRASALANTNNTASVSGYVTVAALSPSWTTTGSVSAQERANVVRDLSGRYAVGATLVDVAANIQQFVTSPTLPACAVYRSSVYDSASVKVNIAKAINSYLSPNTYTWGRTIYPDDLAKAVESASGVDRVCSILGTLAVGMSWQQSGHTMVFTNGSASVTSVNAAEIAAMKPYQTFLADTTNGAVYLVLAASVTTITIDRAFTGATVTATPFYFHSQDTALSNWYSLPYSNLSVDSTSPAASILVVGSV